MKKFNICGKEFTKSGAELWAWGLLRDAPGWEKSHLIFILQWLSRNPEVVVTTSGSTGPPKSIELSKSEMERSALLTASVLGLGPGTKALLCLPSVYIAGKMMLVRAMVNSWNLQWCEPSSSPVQHLKDHIDFIAMTPMQAQHAIDETNEKFNKIGTVLIGGSKVTPALEEKISSCTNRCIASYGMTETCTHVALRNLNGKDATTFFKALPGVKFSLDSRGCLVIHASHLDHPEVVTNDLVKLLDDHSFEYIGRTDNIINSGGIKLFPEQIESKIAHLISSRFIIHKTEDEMLGEKTVLYIEGWPLSDDKTESLMLSMKELLPPYEVPGKISFVLKFQETGTGKIMRRTY